ncbi:MAG: EamA family transporter [Infirmifilum sp.]|uniref:EamA domain-containing protein n=1 Tax=Infirmifilum uzonense TaxID=1550241 RepID=A0A0F7FHX7_9CREN|nr:DMT family transporter [Infirmifilum uzonense]AKG38503.1 hypothetical protein MA03_03310 [Infirmifilum uzonense]
MLWSILALTAALFFAVAGVLYRKAVAGTSLHPLIASGLRSGPAFLVMLLAFLIMGGSLKKPPEFYIVALASSFFAFFAGDSFFIKGLSSAPVGLVYPVAYTFPLFVAVFNFLFTGRKPSIIVLAAAVLMALGIKLAYSMNNGFSFSGLFSGLMASLSWGLGISLASIALRYATPIELNLIRTGILLSTTSPLVMRNLDGIRRINVKWLLLGGTLGIGFGPLALFSAIKLSDPVGPSVISSSAPVLAVLLAAPILGERIEKSTLLGATLVAIATAIASVWG